MDKLIQLEKLNVIKRDLKERIASDKLEILRNKSDEEFIKKNEFSEEKLEKMMRKKMEEIKKIEQKGNQSHMYGFYLRMQEQFEEVKKKVEKLDEVKQKIAEILNESERSKSAAIQGSLKRLSRKFQEYFSYFVKDVETSIKFIRSSTDTKNQIKEEGKSGTQDENSKSGEDKNEQREESKAVKEETETQINIYSNDTQSQGFIIGDHKYIGLSVKVSFKEKGRIQSLKELSGGEKTVVALSLLFALNSLTPSSIYLLDEVDSALDQMYRKGLTEMLSKITTTSSTQIFITSFQQETIESLDSIFKVDYRNCKSTIHPCNKERALMVLKEIKEEQKKEEN